MTYRGDLPDYSRLLIAARLILLVAVNRRAKTPKLPSLSAPPPPPTPYSHPTVSAPCPAEAESRPGPSSVSGRVAPQLAARPTRDLSLPGPATLSSAPPPPPPPHRARARPQYSKVNPLPEGRPHLPPASSIMCILLKILWNYTISKIE